MKPFDIGGGKAFIVAWPAPLIIFFGYKCLNNQAHQDGDAEADVPPDYFDDRTDGIVPVLRPAHRAGPTVVCI